MNDREIPIANIYYLLCYAWGHVQEADIVQLARLAEMEHLEDLLGTVLAAGCARLFRAGMDRGYQAVQEDLAGIRGKIVIGDTVKGALRSRSRVACEFDELSSDILHNQILRRTLKHLLRFTTLHNQVRSEVRAVYTKFSGVTDIQLSRRAFAQVQLDRNRHYYRFLLAICRLIYEQSLVDEVTGDVRILAFSEERMWKVYEDFLIEFYRREQDRYRVNATGRGIRWEREGTLEGGRAMLPRMEADIILEGNGRRIIVDAKYYREALVRGKLNSSHLYQLLAYLRNREATVAGAPRHEGILLYPTVNDEVHIDVCLEGYSIQARSVDLAQGWRKIHDDLLKIVG